MTTNIDVEHISTTSVQFNYFLLLFNYYVSILFVDVRFFHSNEKNALTEVGPAAHLRGLRWYGPKLGYGPCRSCLNGFLLSRIAILLYISTPVHLKEVLPPTYKENSTAVRFSPRQCHIKDRNLRLISTIHMLLFMYSSYFNRTIRFPIIVVSSIKNSERYLFLQYQSIPVEKYVCTCSTVLYTIHARTKKHAHTRNH